MRAHTRTHTHRIFVLSFHALHRLPHLFPPLTFFFVQAPNIDEFAPDANSYIDLRHFASIEALGHTTYKHHTYTYKHHTQTLYTDLRHFAVSLSRSRSLPLTFSLSVSLLLSLSHSLALSRARSLARALSISDSGASGTPIKKRDSVFKTARLATWTTAQPHEGI
jgi:hypothetical protein